MEPEILESVLTEVLGDLREVKQQQAEQIKLLGGVNSKVEAFNQTPAVDTHALALFIKNAICEIKIMISAQPKSVIRQVRLLLFPEHFAEQYYRLVFGRLLFWMMVFLIATYLFILRKHYLVTVKK